MVEGGRRGARYQESDKDEYNCDNRSWCCAKSWAGLQCGKMEKKMFFCRAFPLFLFFPISKW